MTIPTFIDTRLNVDIEQGAQGGPSFLTTVMALSGGQEKRNIEWQYPRQQWDISYGIQTPEDFSNVTSMFYNTFGRALGFRFKDWSDYQIGDPVNYVAALSQPFATSDGVTLIYQLFKTYTISSYSVARPITRPVSGTLKIYANNVLLTEGTDFTVNYDTGQVTFAVTHSSGVVFSVSTEFDVPVRFDSDLFKQQVTWTGGFNSTTGAVELPSISIIELKEYTG